MDNTKNPVPPQKQQQIMNNHCLTTLRVSQSELSMGEGKVYTRLSEGAVAFLTDRSKAKGQVSEQLRQELLKEGDIMEQDRN